MSKSTDLVTGPEQLRLDLEIAAEREVDGIGMGVLSDGTPFLTIRGLARMCGVDHTSLIRLTADWMSEPPKPRELKIRELLLAQGADDSVVFIAIKKSGTIHHAVPAAVCMAVLEYYAFEARSENQHAANSYRVLARKGFSDFIYSQVGYNPTGAPDIAWKQFHDRVSLTYDNVPDGYFSVFKEMADMIVTLLNGGAQVGQEFVPDISVGIQWGKFWSNENLDVVYGERVKFEHNYPLYFPQAASNPQSPWCYPNDALAEFRKWMKDEYIASKMPNYLSQKVKQGKIQSGAATKAIAVLTKPKLLPTKRST